MQKSLIKLTFMAALTVPVLALAAPENYVIDTEKGHASIQFKIKHLGYSWVYGRFDDFGGTFTYDEEEPKNSALEVQIDTASINSNQAERDKHLRGDEFLDVKKFPQATFKSTSYEKTGEHTGVMKGDLTLKGVTKPISIEVTEVGSGEDPWGGFRRGFEGHTEFVMADFGIDRDLGPASRKVDMILSVEGVRQ